MTRRVEESRQKTRPLRRAGVLLEHHELPAVKPDDVAELGVERCTALFHGAVIAPEHHDVVAAGPPAVAGCLATHAWPSTVEVL